MLELERKKNYILARLENAVNEGRKVYIYGCGELGKIVERALGNFKIPVEAFCVDKEFYVGGTINGKIVLKIESVVEMATQDNRPTIVIAFRDYDLQKLANFEKKVEIINEDVFCFHTVNNQSDAWSEDFFKKYADKLSKVYDSLMDEKSHQCMKAFLYQKMTGEFKYLKNVYDLNQYNDSDIVDFNKIRAYIDCGAYDGDSFLSFTQNYQKNTGKRYDGRAYLLEPDEKNYKKMVNNCSEYDNCIFCKVGAWNEKKSLIFSSEGTSSGVAENGDERIEADTIDNLTGKKADFIKMDIEGAELAALQGAKNTIRECHPILAICVYHKCDDLWIISEYIKSIDSSYRLYLRAYSKYSQELVLYAV